MPRAQHVHKYQKRKLGKNKDYVVFACALPNCRHYIAPQLAIGKASLCNKCGEIFLITAEMARPGREQLKPHCDSCTRGRKVKVPSSIIDEFMRNMGLSNDN